MTTILSPEQRSILVNKLVEGGVSRANATIAIDLAAHSADQAVDKFTDALRIAPGMTSGLIALQVGAQLAIARLNSMLESTRELADEDGVKRWEASVKVAV